MKSLKLETRSEKETFKLGKKFAVILKKSPGLFKVILLKGDLGTGKTIFTKGFLSVFNYAEEEVTSPTFIILKKFETDSLNIYHLDLYRLNSSEELDAIGVYEFIEEDNAVSLIEWGEKLNYKPGKPVSAEFTWIDENTRAVTIISEPETLKKLRKVLGLE